MEPDPQLAPAVVSVMVVHEPGEWFESTLWGIAAQDYSSLRSLFLLTTDDDHEIAELTERIRAVVPGGFVRSIGSNPGFGPAVNEVLRLVQGDNGRFLICHDDVALAPDAVRILVEEMTRSNAGIVGPKLVDWDEPRLLQHVGLGLDRLGEVDPVIDPGEFDQEQHDAVRDVFVLPSACLLVRADLFRALDGFDPAISFHGDDVDLCWRAHLTGARVIVAPNAAARHRERLAQRRPDLNHRALRSRHRMRTVAALTSAPRLFVRLVQMLLVTVVELAIGLFTGRFGEALASLRAYAGLLPRAGSILARRRAIRGQRVVHEREILDLQDPGSSRLTSYLRGKETLTLVGADNTVKRWREASFGPLLAWFLVVLAIVIGSRTFIRTGVPAVGEFLAFPSSPGDLWSEYSGSFDGRSFGGTAALPTGFGVLAVVSVLTLFRMALLQMLATVGLYLLAALGAWRLGGVFPTNRARIAAMVVYVATPLAPGLLSRGDWSALIWFTALPWMVHLVRRVAGIETADPVAAGLDLTDGVAEVGARHRVRALAFLTLVVAVAAAFVPVVIVMWSAIGVLLALATLLGAGSWRVAGWFLAATVVSAALGIVLNLPWALEWTWRDLMGVRLAGATGRGLAETASLAPTTDRFALMAIALYLPVLAAVAITRAWRLTWSVRAAVMVLAFGALLVLSERGAVPFAIPRSSLLAVPIALGLALAAATLTDGFGSDVLAQGFGWRQPLGLIANAAIVIGVIPAVLAIGDGAWHTPSTPMPRLLAAQLPKEPAAGDYRVLYVGDPRVLPVPGREFVPGVAWAVVDAGPLDVTDRFVVARTDGDDAVEAALELIASGSTLRAGRILAPLGIRYVVVPEVDGAVSTSDASLPLPDGLSASLGNQLDLGSIYGPPSLEIYVNAAWFPVGAQLTGDAADTSRLAGEAVLVRSDLSGAAPSMVGADAAEPVGANEAVAGALHLAIPYDQRIRLTVDGQPVASRPGFGITTVFDITRPGTAVLSYEGDRNRGWWLASQATLWLAVLVVAAGARASFGRRRVAFVHDETLIDLADVDGGFDGGFEAGFEAGAGPGSQVAGEALASPTRRHDAEAGVASSEIDAWLDDLVAALPEPDPPVGDPGPPSDHPRGPDPAPCADDEPEASS